MSNCGGNEEMSDTRAYDLLLCAMAELRRTARLLDVAKFTDKSFDFHNHHCRVGCDDKADEIESFLRERGFGADIDGFMNSEPEENPVKSVNDVPVLHDEELMIFDELVAVRPISRVPLTNERVELTYAEAGPVLAPFQRVYSVGLQPTEALRALGDKIGWGKLDNFRLEDWNGGSGRVGDEWFCRFTADGTSMKAGGRFVPGGVIVDWWK
jgi:hypothetical protein